MIAAIHSDKQALYEKLENLLNMPAGTVDGSQLLRNLKSWDSLAVLEFIVMADADYQSDLQPTDIAACQTVADLADLTLSSRALNG